MQLYSNVYKAAGQEGISHTKKKKKKKRKLLSLSEFLSYFPFISFCFPHYPYVCHK